MKTLDEVIVALEGSARSGIKDDAIRYLKLYKMLSQGLTSNNVEWDANGIYCKVCGSRLDKDLEIEDNEDIG